MNCNFYAKKLYEINRNPIIHVNDYKKSVPEDGCQENSSHSQTDPFFEQAIN